jgi:hypothetical protein
LEVTAALVLGFDELDLRLGEFEPQRFDELVLLKK